MLFIKLDRLIKILDNCLSRIEKVTISQFFFEEYFNEMLSIVSEVKLPFLNIVILQFIAEMYFKLRHIGGAQKALEKLNFVADLFNDFRALLAGKELLGKCLRDLKRHEESLQCFKF